MDRNDVVLHVQDRYAEDSGWDSQEDFLQALEIAEQFVGYIEEINQGRWQREPTP